MQSFRSAGWEKRFDLLGQKFTRLQFSIFLHVGLCENYIFAVQVQSIFHMKKSIEQANAALSTETLKSASESIRSRTDHSIIVVVGHIENSGNKNFNGMKVLEYL